MTDLQDPLVTAWAALDAGRPDEALRLAWQATMPAVLHQDDEALNRAALLAEEIAARSEGPVRQEALQNAAYWAACVTSPRDGQGSAWSFRRWFSRPPRQVRIPCPECAESIMKDARVCRFCGHRLD